MADITPTCGWICTDPCLLAMSQAMLDEEYEDPSTKLGHIDGYRIGRVGSEIVVINSVLKSALTTDIADAAQSMTISFSGIKAILITSLGSGSPSAGIKCGDLVINPATNRYDDDAESSSTLTPNIVESGVFMLQKEVGADGHWLSSNLPLAVSNFPVLSQLAQRPRGDLPDYPQLHYGNTGLEDQDIQNRQLHDQLPAKKNIICLDTVASGLTNVQIPIIVIRGISNCIGSSESDAWKWYAAANAASYGKEFIQVMANNLMNCVPDLEGTENLVPSHMDPKLPPFQFHQYPSHGNAVLLVIPTENDSKKRLLQEAFRERAPHGVTVHTVTMSINSEVGEQPYNKAGIIGAHARISNALLRLDAAEYQEIFKVKMIGTVIFASIESYIQTENVDRPTDYGVVVIHNATTQQTSTRISCGVTVPPAYVNRARRFGFEGDPNKGRVTVGQILAAHVPGLNKADWQSVLARHSRYDLLKDALSQVPIPW